jgi:hypothetical protein
LRTERERERARARATKTCRHRDLQTKRPADKDTLRRGRAASEDFKLFEACFPQKFSVYVRPTLRKFVTGYV